MNEFLNFFLDEAVDILVGWEKVSLRLEQDSSAETKDELYRAAHNLKSGSGAVGLDAFHHLVHAVEDLISQIMGQEGEVPSSVIRIFLETHSTLAAWVDRLRNGDETIPQPEIDAILLSLVPFLGERSSKESTTDDEDQEVEEQDEVCIESQPEVPSISEVKKPSASIPAPKPQETIRVASQKLDNLIELVGELATQQAIVWHGRQLGALDSESCDNAIHLIQKIAKDLQGLSLSLRLQPLQNLFQRLERTIRDLARSQDKRIDVILKGEDVELDKSVAERIADALTHVVRNAIDHGVELSQDRIAAGKSPVASITLEATPSANGVLIRISDDGRGLNAEKIRNKAVERGIISANALLADNDVHRLIFHAGLSTAEKVTDVSGRGVGMDVVKTSVENIGGSIQLSSRMGLGTTFSISLPATLSIVDALLVSAGHSLYALPLQDVAEIIDLNEIDVQSMPGGKRLFTLRNSVIPLEDLADHLPIEMRRAQIERARLREFSKTHASSMQPAILVRSGDSLLAFKVKGLAGQQLVTVRGLPNAIAHIPGYTGGTILGDGNPCVVLNLIALASRHFEEVHRGSSTSHTQNLIAQSKFEESYERFLVMEHESHIFAVSLVSVREILENIHSENLLGNAETKRSYIAVRGELIPVFDVSGYSQSEHCGTFVVTADGKRAFGVDRILAVSTLDLVENHGMDLSQRDSGVLGFRKFHDRYIPLIDLSQAMHLNTQLLLKHPFEGRNVS